MNFANVTDWTIYEGSVIRVTDSLNRIIWEKNAQPIPTTTYFYVEDASGSANTITIKKKDNKAPSVKVFYSTDQQNWTNMGTTSYSGITATIPANGKLYLKATQNTWCTTETVTSGGLTRLYIYYNEIISGNDYNVGGNILSLIYGDNFNNQTTFPNNSNWNLYGLFFSGGTTKDNKVIDASNLILTPTTLTSYCYRNMFENCKWLTTPPVILATTLATNCCTGMFSECSALTTAPALPATTLANYCYSSMFYDCTALTTAPTLPATTLANNCYENMFAYCSSLTTAPTLPATTLADECYEGMFGWCTSLTTAPALPATNLNYRCYVGMFNGCTSLTTAPALPATTLAQSCYQSMFYNCSVLTSVTTYASNISASNCLTNWLYNVAAEGDFWNLGSASFPSGVNGIPSGWTEHTSL